MKKCLIVVLGLAIIFAFAACGGPTQADKTAKGSNQKVAGNTVYNLKIGTYNPEDSADGVAAKAFKAYAEEHSNGRIMVDVYHNSVLGNAKTQIEGVTMGSQDFFIPGMELLTSWDPMFNVPQMYFLFDSVDHLRAFYNSDMFAKTIANLESQNILLMDKTWAGQQGPFRVLVSKDPITSYKDIVGDRVRVYDSKAQYAIWEAFEASTYVVTYSEIYMALQQGMIETFEVPFNVVVSNSYCDIAKYITKFESYYQIYNIIGNKKKVETLPEDLQKVLYDAATFAMQAYTKNVQEDLQSDLDYLTNKLGVTYYDKMDYTPFRKKMQPVYDQLIQEGVIPKGVVEYVRGLRY